MFVQTGARAALIAKRRDQFYDQYVAPLLREAARLGINAGELTAMLQKGDATDEQGR